MNVSFFDLFILNGVPPISKGSKYLEQEDLKDIYLCRIFKRFSNLMTELFYSDIIINTNMLEVTKVKPTCFATLRRLDLIIRFVTTALDSRHALQNMMTVRQIRLEIFLTTFLLFQENKLCYEAAPPSARCST